jgi:hypothetical protein
LWSKATSIYEHIYFSQMQNFQNEIEWNAEQMVIFAWKAAFIDIFRDTQTESAANTISFCTSANINRENNTASAIILFIWNLNCTK